VIGRGEDEDSWAICPPNWACASSVDQVALPYTDADTRTGKIVGGPYWGKPDVRFDEGSTLLTANMKRGERRTWNRRLSSKAK